MKCKSCNKNFKTAALFAKHKCKPKSLPYEIHYTENGEQKVRIEVVKV